MAIMSVTEVLKDIEQHPKYCKDHLLERLKKVAQRLKLSTTGTKVDICSRVTKELKTSSPKAKKQGVKQDKKQPKKQDKTVKQAPLKVDDEPQKKQYLYNSESDIELRPDSSRLRPLPIQECQDRSDSLSKLFKPNLDVVRAMTKDLPTCDSRQVLQYSYVNSLIEDHYSGKFVTNPQQDAKLQMNLQCVAKSILQRTYNANFYNSEGIEVALKTINQFLDLKRIESDSKYGIAYLTNVVLGGKKINKFFAVLKVAKRIEDLDVFHELAVGFSLNKLRTSIPYFMYCYGGFYCPRVDKSGDLCATTGNSKSITTFSLNECVPNAKDILKAVKEENYSAKKTEQILGDVFSQVAHALALAQKRFRFQHNDLHASNVLLRSTPLSKVQCKGEGYSFTLHSVKTMPTIIDYGKSVITVKVDGKERVVCNGDEPDKGSKATIEDLGCSDDYFVSGYDIFRYTTNTLLDLIRKKSNDKQYHGVIEQMWKKCVQPFANRAHLAKYSLTRKALEANDIYEYEEYSERDSNIDYAYVKDKEVFKVSMSSWINNFMKK